MNTHETNSKPYQGKLHTDSSPSRHDHVLREDGVMFCQTCQSGQSSSQDDLDASELVNRWNNFPALQSELEQLRRENKILKEVACNACRIQELTKENYPHRSPTWVHDYPDSPIKSAMNNLLESIDVYRAALKLAGGKDHLTQ